MSQDIQICQTLSCLPEKFIVDFVNSIDVANDHLSVQKEKCGTFTRLYEGFTGTSSRRQAEINSSLTYAVEGSLKWLTELSESLARSNYSLTKVNDRVNELKLVAAKIANHSADTRQQLESLSERLDQRCQQIENEIIRIDFTQRAQLHLDQVFHKWAAGRYHNFSLAGRCYAAAEELYWGTFGDFCRAHPQEAELFKEDAVNRAISQLAADAGTSLLSSRLAVKQWLHHTDLQLNDSEYIEALSYMGNIYNPQDTPFAFTASQSPAELPTFLPRLCTPQRLSESMIEEVFGDRTHV